jgi:hypothetical protein
MIALADSSILFVRPKTWTFRCSELHSSTSSHSVYDRPHPSYPEWFPRAHRATSPIIFTLSYEILVIADKAEAAFDYSAIMRYANPTLLSLKQVSMAPISSRKVDQSNLLHTLQCCSQIHIIQASLP